MRLHSFLATILIVLVNGQNEWDMVHFGTRNRVFLKCLEESSHWEDTGFDVSQQIRNDVSIQLEERFRKRSVTTKAVNEGVGEKL